MSTPWSRAQPGEQILNIELIFERSCPNINAAREQLRLALLRLGLNLPWQEWDQRDPTAPEYARRWGSPTILVNGRDVGGEQAGVGDCCRIYHNPDHRGTPSAEDIMLIIQSCS